MLPESENFCDGSLGRECLLWRRRPGFNVAATLGGLIPLAILMVSASAGQGAGSHGKVSYNRDVRPIFADNCYNCHGPDTAKRKAGLRLDERAGATSKLESGHFAIVPGDPAKSRLLHLTATEDSDDRMPPAKTGRRLNKTQIDTLTRWIQEGAEWEAHWAYVPPERPPVPAVKNEAWPRKQIDRFVLARLEQEKLPPSPEADRHTLARRLSFDLTGLPPTAEEVDRFLSDKSPEAYEKLLDKLLASEQFGERMAIQWLDLARFADSDGYHADIQRSMWQYRDYVIGAFNKNLPFDRFVVEQLAGDLLEKPTLEQRIATAFNRNGMSSTEGGADPDEYMNKYVTDRVNTFGTVFLGSTIQCAECHNHKYDPFTQREYYELYDFFNRVPEKGLDADPAPPFVKVPVGRQAAMLEKARHEASAKAAEHKTQIDLARPEWDQAQILWEERLRNAAAATEGFKLGEWSSVGPFEAGSGGEAFKTEFGPETDADASRTYADGKLKWKKQPKWKDGKPQELNGSNAATYLFRTITAESQKPLVLYLGSDDALRVWLNGKEVISKDINRGVAANQDTVEVTLEAGHNRLLLKVVNYGGAYAYYFSTDKEAGDEKIIKLRELAKISQEKRKPEQLAELKQAYREREIPEIKKLAEELAALRKQESDIDKSIATIRVMEDMPKPRESYIRVRGDYRTKGEVVSAGVPTSALPPMQAVGRTNRLALAEWLVQRNHPLTSRVAVNRFWALFFQRPIVNTANEFGTQGEPPSHPELLDYLAREFVDSGWNVKGFIKEVLMSATYRQSSKVRPDHITKDPENRLMARGARFRLPAEMVRDNALAISGLLVEKIGGPSVRPYQPPGLWEEKMFAGNKYELGSGDELYRRSLYTLWKRSILNPTMQTFDAPDRAICSVSRPTTCTPLQALVTMNDVTFVEAARVFAQRIFREGGSDTASRLKFALRAALGRPPGPHEEKILEGVLSDVRRSYAADETAAGDILKLGRASVSGQFDRGELAAWTGVANVILNLDETVTRE